MHRLIHLHTYAAQIFVIILSIASVSPVSAQNAMDQRGNTAVHREADLAVSSAAPAELRILERAIRRGDTAAMMPFTAAHVNVTLFGANELYSRSQAYYVLKEFFTEFRPGRLSLEETSGSDDNWFAAGSYWYLSGESPLAIYLRLRREDVGWELREVRIGRTSGR